MSIVIIIRMLRDPRVERVAIRAVVSGPHYASWLCPSTHPLHSTRSPIQGLDRCRAEAEYFGDQRFHSALVLLERLQVWLQKNFQGCAVLPVLAARAADVSLLLATQHWYGTTSKFTYLKESDCGVLANQKPLC